MSASAHPGGTYPERTAPRPLRVGRLVRALGFEPFFLAALVVAVSAGAGLGLVVAAVGAPAPADGAVATADSLVTRPPPWETTWLMPIRLQHGRPVGGIQRIEVDQGDEVAIGVDLDTAATISVEGYGLWTYVHAYQKGLLELTAWEWGRFRVRADGHLIGILSVRPQWAGPSALG